MDRGIMYAPSTMGHDGFRLPRPDPEGGHPRPDPQGPAPLRDSFCTAMLTNGT